MKKIVLFLISSLLLSLSLLAQTEICNNGIDDDGDGYIDLFDPDCPCSDSTYQAYCPVNCVYLPDSFPDFKMKLKWETHFLESADNLISALLTSTVAGDIDSDGSIEVLCFNWDSLGVGIYNGEDGSIQKMFRLKYPHISFLSIADVDRDGRAEIFCVINALLGINVILCYDIDGNLIWETEDLNRYFGVMRAERYITNIADFNGDGIPEVYYGPIIINSLTGKILCVGYEGWGGAPYIKKKYYYYNLATVAGDFLPDSPGLELAAGNTVYKVSITNTQDSIGNTMIPVLADTVVKDGFTGVADIDGDGQLDVVVVRSTVSYLNPGIWVWNPRTQALISKGIGGELMGLPFIGDVDGDCIPEIGVVTSKRTFGSGRLRLFKYDGTQTLQQLYAIPTTDLSGLTGITMFDFNQDGRNELVYRDQDTLRIIEGSTGRTIAATFMNSGTIMEYPIVADIDNDGQAEILVNGYNASNIKSPIKLYAFESAGAPWAPARSVWNQTAYNVTNVNDDLTIPRYPQHPATVIQGMENCLQPTCPQVYNSFMAQATYRTQQGCVQWASLDLQPELLDWACSDDSVTLRYVIHNHSDGLGARDTFGLQIYNENPYDKTTQDVYTGKRYLEIEKGAVSDTFSLKISQQDFTDKLYIVVNVAGNSATPLVLPLSNIAECDYNNNIDSIEVEIELLPFDLGEDITRCDTGQITLYAPEGFESYLWQDSVATREYTVKEDGQYYVKAMDQCGQKYRDTIQLTSYVISKPEIIGQNVEACAGDSLEFYIQGDYDKVKWQPREKVNCDSCKEITAIADTSYELIVIGKKGGCTNMDTISIRVKISEEKSITQRICAGDSVLFYGQILKQEGRYTHTVNKCDSIINLSLEVIPAKAETIRETICSGDSIEVGGQWWNSSGLYKIGIKSTEGCDSIITLELKVQDSIINRQYFTLCPQDSIQIEGQWIRESGEYVYEYSSQYGCDSTYIAQVNKLKAPGYPELEIDCDKPEVKASIDNPDSQWQIQWSSGARGAKAIYHGGEQGKVEMKTEPDCELSYEFAIPDLPDLTQIPYFADTIIKPESTVTLNTGINTEDWHLQWSPSEYMDCETCGSVSITVESDTQITLQLTHKSGCVYTVSFKIKIDYKEEVYVPNIFTPDGDGKNDKFYITFKDYYPQIIEAAIYDRWGEKMAEWHNVPNIDWDGTFKGRRVNPGVFVYYIKYKNRKGEIVILKGDVTVP